MRDPSFVYDHAGLRKPFLQFLAERSRHIIHTAAQGGLVLFAMIVSVTARQMPDGRLALHLHVGLVVLDIEDRLSAVLNPPDHDGRDLDRVAAVVVDLEALS